MLARGRYKKAPRRTLSVRISFPNILLVRLGRHRLWLKRIVAQNRCTITRYGDRQGAPLMQTQPVNFGLNRNWS